MSGGHEAVVRRLFELSARGEHEAGSLLLHPEIEWHVTDVFLEASVYRGREQVLAFNREWASSWDELAVDVDEIRVEGSTVLVAGCMRGRAAASGIEITAPRWWLLDMRDGLVWRWRSFTSEADAIAAAPVSFSAAS